MIWVSLSDARSLRLSRSLFKATHVGIGGRDCVCLLVLLGEGRQQILSSVIFVAVDDDLPQRVSPADFLFLFFCSGVHANVRPREFLWPPFGTCWVATPTRLSSTLTNIKLNFFSIHFKVFLPVEYFSMSGIKALSCAWVIFSTGVGMPSIINGGSSNSDGSSWTFGGACWASAESNSSITMFRRFLMTSSSGLAPNTL